MHASDHDPDRAALLAYQADGRREHLEELWRRHWEESWRLAHWICGTWAEDALQEAALSLVRDAGRWKDRGAGSARAWLYTVVRNAARKQRRKEVPAWRPLTYVGDMAAPMRAEQRDERWELARAALARLAPRLRLAVELRYLAGLDFPTVATALGVSERTARTRVTRGLDHVRSRLNLDAANGTPAVVVLLAPLDLPAPPPGLDALVAQATVASPAAVPAMSASGAVGLGFAAVIAAGVGILAAIHAFPVREQLAPPTAQAVGDPPPALPVAPGLAVLDRPISVVLRRCTLNEALHLLRGSMPWPQRPQFTASIHLLPAPAAGLTLTATQQPLRMVLDELCRQADWRWRATSRGVIIDRPDPAGAAAAIKRFLAATTTDGWRSAALAVAACLDADALRELVLAGLDGHTGRRAALCWIIDEAHHGPILRSFAALDDQPSHQSHALLPLELLADDPVVAARLAAAWSDTTLSDDQRISLCVLAERTGCQGLVGPLLELVRPHLETLHLQRNGAGWALMPPQSSEFSWWSPGQVTADGSPLSLPAAAYAALVGLSPTSLAAVAATLPTPIREAIWCRVDDPRGTALLANHALTKPCRWSMPGRGQVDAEPAHWVDQNRSVLGLDQLHRTYCTMVPVMRTRNPELLVRILSHVALADPGRLPAIAAALARMPAPSVTSRGTVTGLTALLQRSTTPSDLIAIDLDPLLMPLVAEVLVGAGRPPSASPLTDDERCAGLAQVILTSGHDDDRLLAICALGLLHTPSADATLVRLAGEPAAPPALVVGLAWAGVAATDAVMPDFIRTHGLDFKLQHAARVRRMDTAGQRVSPRDAAMYPAFLSYFQNATFSHVVIDTRPPDVAHPLLRTMLADKWRLFGFRRPDADMESEIAAVLRGIVSDPTRSLHERLEAAEVWLSPGQTRAGYRAAVDAIIATSKHGTLTRELERMRDTPLGTRITLDLSHIPDEAPATPQTAF